MVLNINYMFYIIPLLVAFSLVHGATRDERMSHIMVHSLQAAKWMISFVGMVFLILLAISLLI